jgi:hypothetical protein
MLREEHIYGGGIFRALSSAGALTAVNGCGHARHRRQARLATCGGICLRPARHDMDGISRRRAAADKRGREWV